MLCEVEAVGDGSRQGDAIIVHYGDPAGYHLMIVDGGTTSCGETLLAHLKKHFGALVSLEHVVVTHSDADHASGLRELLREIPVTHAWLHIPESSVILYANRAHNRRILLTGDAGLQALSWAAAYARVNGYPLQSFSLVQIPHRGSRRNVGPTLLNELLGPIQPEGITRFTTFLSSPKDNDTHPRKIVLNAFIRRGGKVIATQSTNKIHYGGFPQFSSPA
jgi:beta-lactamase superfamily II metal-dependent hydrolase